MNTQIVALRLQAHLSWWSKRHADFVSVGVFAIGAALSIGSHVAAERSHRLTLHDVTALRDYSYVATLDPTGRTGKAGRYLTETTAISRLIDSVYNVLGERSVSPKCSQETFSLLEAIREKEPKFPFTYWIAANCLRKAGDTNWVAFADSALHILSYTTAIADHHPSHDNVYEQLTKWLEEVH